MKKQFDINAESLAAHNYDPDFAIGPLLYQVNTHDYGTYRRTLAAFSFPQRYIFAVLLYIMEVENGGHDQFFFNSAGIVWQDALAGLNAIGATAAAEIFRRVLEQFNGKPSFDRSERQAQLAALRQAVPDMFDAQDRAFYELGSPELQMRAYIRAHAEEFKATAGQPD